MLISKLTYRALQFFIFALIVLSSCKKTTKKDDLIDKSIQKTNSLTKVFADRYNVDEIFRNAQNNKTQIFVSGMTVSYSITSGCSSNTLDLTDIIIGSTLAGQPSYYIILNGTTFYPTYIGRVAGFGYWRHHFQLLGVSLSSIGISDFCQTASINADHYAGGNYLSSETLPINEGVSCGSGSYQCSASSPGTGQLSFYLPYLGCGCNNMYPPTYTFRYRLQGTSTWTTVPTSNPGYFSIQTVSGLAAGVYEVYGQNTCSQNQSPSFVPAISSPVTVP